MPHALTDRQREYLEFIRNFVAKNESSPRLDEIANHFNVAAPTVHKMLEALQAKGFLYFGRDSLSGFFIRLIERAGSPETVVEIAISGKINEYGEVLDFPQEYGHFATLLMGSKPGEVFALGAIADIPPASILNQDLLIFDIGKKPQPGDVALVPIGQRLFLALIHSKTFDKDTLSFEMRQEYPIPLNLTDPNLGQYLNWYPLATDDKNGEYYIHVAEEQKFLLRPLPPEFVVATALRLTRQLAW